MKSHTELRSQRYRVRVGHLEVTVYGRSTQEAIRLARKELSRQLPRLWDVLHRIGDQQFRVDPPH